MYKTDVLMRISVRVKPNAKKKEVVVQEGGSFLVRLTVPPIEGRANEQLIEVLAEYFGKPKRDIEILKGLKGRLKIVEIL